MNGAHAEKLPEAEHRYYLAHLIAMLDRQSEARKTVEVPTKEERERCFS
ncbi:MAG: hypothetical protein ACLQVF_37215 [Isosphaeraceae bacterium]